MAACHSKDKSPRRVSYTCLKSTEQAQSSKHNSRACPRSEEAGVRITKVAWAVGRLKPNWPPSQRPQASNTIDLRRSSTTGGSIHFGWEGALSKARSVHLAGCAEPLGIGVLMPSHQACAIRLFIYMP